MHNYGSGDIYELIIQSQQADNTFLPKKWI